MYRCDCLNLTGWEWENSQVCIGIRVIGAQFQSSSRDPPENRQGYTGFRFKSVQFNQSHLYIHKLNDCNTYESTWALFSTWLILLVIQSMPYIKLTTASGVLSRVCVVCVVWVWLNLCMWRLCLRCMRVKWSNSRYPASIHIKQRSEIQSSSGE